MLAGGGGTDDMHGLMTKKVGNEHNMKTVVWRCSADRDQCKYLGSILFHDIVHATAFSPSGKLLAVGGENRILATLLVDENFEKASDLGCAAGIRCLAWTADSSFLASGGEDMQVSVWDVAAEVLVLQLPKAKDWHCAIAFTHDSSWLACCGFDSKEVGLHPVEVFEPAKEKAASRASESEAPQINVASARTSSARTSISIEAPKNVGFQVAVASTGAPLHVRRSSTEQVPTAEDLGFKMSVAAADGPQTRSSAARASLIRPANHDSLKSCGTVKFKPLTKQAAGAANGTLGISVPGNLARRPSNASIIGMGGISEGFQLKVHQVGGQQGSSDSKALVSRISERKSQAAKLLGVKLRPLQLRLDASRQAVSLRHKDEVTNFAFCADGKKLVAAGEDKMVVLWDLESRERMIEAKMNHAVLSVAYGPSGRYIAGGDSGSFVTVWDTLSQEEAGTASVEGEPLTIALTSKPSDLLAVGTTAKKVLLLSVPDMEEIADLRHDGHVHSISFSPDGGMLAGGGGTDDMHGLMTKKVAENHEMKTVMWRVSSDGDSCKYLGSILFEDIVHATAFSPTGKLLAVGGENRMIATLLVDRDFEKASELLCTAGVRCLAWSPDSRFLASGGEDMMVSVFDVLSEGVVLQLPKVEDWLCSVAFSTDGRWLASCGYGDSAVTLHPVETVRDERAAAQDDSGSDSGDESDGSSAKEEAAPLAGLQISVSRS